VPTTIIVKNPGASSVGIQDMGIVLEAGTQETFVGTDGSFSIGDVYESVDLATHVGAGTLVIHDGTSDLSAADGVKHVNVQTQLEDEPEDSGGTGNHVGSSAPTGTPAAGNLWFHTGTGQNLLYCYDGSRSKWLSVQRLVFAYGKKGKAKDVYMEALDGIGEPESMYDMLRNATVTGIGVAAEEVHSGAAIDIEIRANEVKIGHIDTTVSEPFAARDENLNLDIAQGAMLQLYINSPNNKKIEDTVAWVEVAWRAS